MAGVFPLFFDIATKTQATAVGNVLRDKFLKPGGLVTTLNFTGQQWDAPNGWAPLQWISYRGLMNHDLTDLAQQVQARWMKVNESVYQSSGKMTEKYDVCNEDGVASGGEYPNQDGFGWTNGVLLAWQWNMSRSVNSYIIVRSLIVYCYVQEVVRQKSFDFACAL